jgi:hypothetical protein
MKERKWRILVLRVAAPIVALFTVLGIMGSAGALPRGLQRLTSNAAGVVGFDLPSGEDEGDTTGTTEDDQGENTDDQGDQNDQGDSTSGDQGDQNDQGDSTSTSGSSDQGDQNDQGDSSGDSGSGGGGSGGDNNQD